MTKSFSHFYRDGLALLKRRNASGDFLLLAFAALIASLVLSNNYNVPPKIFLLVILPAAFCLHGRVLVRPSWPMARLSVSYATRLVFSLILFAAFIYVIALTISTWQQPDVNRRMVDQMWVHAGLILLFMVIVAQAVAFVDRFLIRLIAISIPLIAIGAGLNIFYFLRALPAFESVLQVRLVNWLGMPGYTNSTNISLTYAIFFVTALAAITVRGASLRLRLWLAPFATVLLAAMLLTQARSAYIGTAIGAGIVLFVAKDKIFWKKNALMFGAAMLAAAIAVGSVAQIRGVVTARGESQRPEIWTIYLGKAIAKPVLGYGGLSNIGITVNDNAIDQPHNLILSAQIRGGIFCMLAMITMLAASAWFAFRFQRQRGCAIPLAMIATIIPTGLFDYNLLITAATWPWLTFWLPLAICAGAEIALRSEGMVGDVGLEPTTR